jgi:hypothetical protein
MIINDENAARQELKEKCGCDKAGALKNRSTSLTDAWRYTVRPVNVCIDVNNRSMTRQANETIRQVMVYS